MGFTLIFLVSYLLTWWIRSYALKHSHLDIPNERSSHVVPVPHGGGLAIVCSFFLALGWLYLSIGLPPSLIFALLSSGLVALIGYIDDRKDVSALTRLAVQIVAACIALYFLKTPIWLFFPALFSIIWLTNLYNFMDGIDGLAGMQGIFVSLAAASALMATNNMPLGIMLAAAIAGFLMWNWSPARIFMGDVGSGALGFIFAVWALWTIQAGLLSLPFWLIIMAVFLSDATFTLLKRMWKRERWYSAHRSHVYQRLVQRGYSHKRVTLGILFFNLLLLLPVAYLSIWKPDWAWGLLIGVYVVCAGLWYRCQNQNLQN